MKQTTTQKTARKQQLIKMGVFAGLGLLFALSIWFIFKPSQSEVEKDLIGLGLNDKVPQATTQGLPEDKSKAYEQAWQLEAEKEKKKQLNDLANYFDSRTKNEGYQPHYQPEKNGIDESVNRYQNAHRELEQFYTTPATTYDEEKEALKERLQALEEKLQEQKQAEDDKAEQLALMEKSYEMAAKYMPQTTGQKQEMPTQNQPPNSALELPTIKVQKAEKKVVSMLQQEVADSVFIKEQMQERNRCFYSVAKAPEVPVVKNTLKVCVHQTTLLKNGQTLALRLLEKAQIGNLCIPQHTLLTAKAQVQGNRLRLQVHSIAYKEQLLGVKLTAFELDGQEGVFIPCSDEMNAIKEVASNMGSSAGQSFTFSSSAGQQIMADMGKGILNGTSKLLSKKLKEVKVTLKAGHLLYLVQEK